MNKLFLGKHSPRLDARTLKFASYLAPALPPAPPVIDWGQIVSGNNWRMMANDSVGDCTCAAAGHLEMMWTGYGKKSFVPSDAQILAAYSAITGYSPNNPNSDNGANVLDVLNYWRKSGIAGRKIVAYVAVDHTNREHLRLAVDMFGGCYIGVQLPQSAMDDFNADKPWKRLTGKILGGHAIVVVGYDANTVSLVTWGKEIKASWPWFEKYCDEAFVILSKDWAGKNPAPSSFNFAQLVADLVTLKN